MMEPGRETHVSVPHSSSFHYTGNWQTMAMVKSDPPPIFVSKVMLASIQLIDLCIVNGCFMLHWQGWIIATETIEPAKPIMLST